MAEYKNTLTDKLFETIAQLNSPEECAAFFEDLCTIKEMLDMAQRLETARLLECGMSYQKIAEKLGVSTATISRVNRCLNYGTGGYRAAIEKCRENEK